MTGKYRGGARSMTELYWRGMKNFAKDKEIFWNVGKSGIWLDNAVET